MEQCNIYNYIGEQDDPLYQSLKSLKTNQTISLNGVQIRLNAFNLYELECSDSDYAFSNLRKCYCKLLEIIDNEIPEK